MFNCTSVPPLCRKTKNNGPKYLLKDIWKFEIVFRHLYKYTIIELNGMKNVFKGLNDPTRREILELLKRNDMTAGEIVEQFHISGSSISHHLDVLKQAKLVIAEKQGQFIYYSLNTTIVDEIMKWLLQIKTKSK
jgi:ArsR family transcriptional regulator, repressor of sdpIR and other operons